jgi:hypothetical protein
VISKDTNFILRHGLDVEWVLALPGSVLVSGPDFQ